MIGRVYDFLGKMFHIPALYRILTYLLKFNLKSRRCLHYLRITSGTKYDRPALDTRQARPRPARCGWVAAVRCSAVSVGRKLQIVLGLFL